MSMKVKRLYVAQRPMEQLGEAAGQQYRIEKVTNSTTPRIGEVLTEDQLDKFCRHRLWEVTIK